MRLSPRTSVASQALIDFATVIVPSCAACLCEQQASLTTLFAALAAEKGVDLAKEEERYALRETIEAELAPWFAARPLDEIGKALDAVGACWGPYQTFDELVKKDPRCSEANPLIRKIFQKGLGEFPAAGLPLRFQELEEQPLKPAPSLGEHTDEVISNILGLPDHTISDFHDRGIIA